MCYKYLRKIGRLELYIFGNNHSRDIESRQLLKITTQSEIAVITVIVNSWFIYIPN